MTLFEKLQKVNIEKDVKVVKFFNSSEEESISLWLCDKVIEAVDNDPLATQGIKMHINIHSV